MGSWLVDFGETVAEVKLKGAFCIECPFPALTFWRMCTSFSGCSDPDSERKKFLFKLLAFRNEKTDPSRRREVRYIPRQRFKAGQKMNRLETLLN